MSKILRALRDIEREAGRKLDNGIANALKSNKLYGAASKSNVTETTINEDILSGFENLRASNISVVRPPEALSGSDLEVHVRLQDNKWCGLRIQGKKATLRSMSSPNIAEMNFEHLDYGTNSPGQQWATLMESSAEEGILPIYGLYTPLSFLRVVYPALLAERKMSSLMLCSAWELDQFISRKDFDAAKIIRNGRPLHQIFSSLADNEQNFIAAAKTLFPMHVMEPDPDQEFSDLEFQDEYGEEIGAIYPEAAPAIEIPRQMPAKIEELFESENLQTWWRGKNLCGAIKAQF